MWLRLTRPDILVFLDVSYETTLVRKRLNWTVQEFEEQLFRLRHARLHADLIIDTDQNSPQEIADLVMQFIGELSK